MKLSGPLLKGSKGREKEMDGKGDSIEFSPTHYVHAFIWNVQYVVAS